MSMWTCNISAFAYWYVYQLSFKAPVVVVISKVVLVVFAAAKQIYSVNEIVAVVMYFLLAALFSISS